MAEIEHFCDPSDKSHAKFESVKDVAMNFYSASNQMEGRLAEKRTIGDAVRAVSHLAIWHAEMMMWKLSKVCF